jgi:hypothetical protein
MSDPLNDAFAKSIRQRVRTVMLSDRSEAEKEELLSFELLNSVSDRLITYRRELLLRYASSVISCKGLDKLLRARDAPDRLGRDGHI